DEDLTHEPEQIKAYRDTWQLGIHSYLTYLRNRLLLPREAATNRNSTRRTNLRRELSWLSATFNPTMSWRHPSGQSQCV
ncbi:MAG: hypothetical protein RMK61_09205, partial [Bacteroidota bacterium]|nr:hypothetical protein [Bacteroidota bacterium]